jgi:FAD/FMN-containing dehydrogenase
VTATEWAHLPNAALIDRILADVAQRPKVWAAAREAAREAAWGGAWVAAWDAVRNAARDAALDAVQDAARAVSRIIASGIVPAALEMMDNATIRCVEASIYAAGYPVDAAAVLLCEVDGVAEGLDEDVAIIRDACLATGARSVTVATTW